MVGFPRGTSPSRAAIGRTSTSVADEVPQRTQVRERNAETSRRRLVGPVGTVSGGRLRLRRGLRPASDAGCADSGDPDRVAGDARSDADRDPSPVTNASLPADPDRAHSGSRDSHSHAITRRHGHTDVAPTTVANANPGPDGNRHGDPD